MEYKHVDIKQILLDKDNPRISDILSGMSGQDEEIQEFIKEHLAGDTGNSEPGPSCLELKKSIMQSKGIIEPIIILDNKDGTFLCVEGNTRLSIYLKFSKQYEDDKTWKSIPSLVHDELSPAEIDALRLQAHFVGKKEWTPYAKGRYIKKLLEGGMQFSDIKEIVGGSDAKIRANYYAFDNYVKYYEPLFEQDQQSGIFPDKQKISMFVAIPKGGKHSISLEERRHTIQDFASWVKDDKVGSANDVRRFLDKVMNHDEAYSKFIKKGGTLKDSIPLLPSDTSISSVTLKNASFIQICDYLNDSLLMNRNDGNLNKIIEQEGPGVVDSMNLLNGELVRSIAILEEE